MMCVAHPSWLAESELAYLIDTNSYLEMLMGAGKTSLPLLK